MKIKLVFYKSSSKYYDNVCLQCEAFDLYVQEKFVNTLVIDSDDIRQMRGNVESILEIIKKWSKTEYYLDDRRVSLQRIMQIFAVLDCEKKCKECVINNEYCHGDAGWGCKFLGSIALRRSQYPYRSLYRWYDFGHFDNGEWIIDKDRMRSTLIAEATEKSVLFCKFFTESRIESALNALPDKIVVTDSDDCEWCYKYREAPLGMTQTEIVGVKPRPKSPVNSDGNHSYEIIIKKSGIDINNSMATINNGEVVKNKNIPTVTFEDIGGIDDIIQQIREVIELPLVAPALFEHYHVKSHKGILLCGPPGCGKTMIAKAIANEINAHFILVNGPEILNKYLGQSEENLRDIFEEAKMHIPSVIYFDEFDSISSARDSESNPHMASIVNQLLTLMDGVDSSSRICAIASTNRIDMIDEAVKRPGRFDYILEIPLPTPQGCKSIFRIHTKKMPVDKHFDQEAFVDKYLLGSSGAEIAFVASEAAYNAIRRTIDTKKVFSGEFVFSATNKNVILECDFIKAAQSLEDSRRNR